MQPAPTTTTEAANTQPAPVTTTEAAKPKKKKTPALKRPLRMTIPLAVGLIYVVSLLTWHIAYIAVFALLVAFVYFSGALICYTAIDQSECLREMVRKNKFLHLIGMCLGILLVAGILAFGGGAIRYTRACSEVRAHLALLDEQATLREKELRVAMEHGIVEDTHHCVDFFEAYNANCTLRESDLRKFLASPVEDIMLQFKLAKPSQEFVAAMDAVRNITQQMDETKNDQTFVRAFSVTQMLTDALTPIRDKCYKNHVYWPALPPLLASIVLAQLGRMKWWRYGCLVLFVLLWFTQPTWAGLAEMVIGKEAYDKMSKEEFLGATGKVALVPLAGNIVWRILQAYWTV